MSELPLISALFHDCDRISLLFGSGPSEMSGCPLPLVRSGLKNENFKLQLNLYSKIFMSRFTYKLDWSCCALFYPGTIDGELDLRMIESYKFPPAKGMVRTLKLFSSNNANVLVRGGKRLFFSSPFSNSALFQQVCCICFKSQMERPNKIGKTLLSISTKLPFVCLDTSKTQTSVKNNFNEEYFFVLLQFISS